MLVCIEVEQTDVEAADVNELLGRACIAIARLLIRLKVECLVVPILAKLASIMLRMYVIYFVPAAYVCGMLYHKYGKV